MSKINILTGQSVYDLSKKVIGSIKDYQDLSCDNLIIVPDRFSLNAEKLVFSELNIDATFNIHVMGIGTLAKQIIIKSGLECVFVSSEESKLILYRAMQKCCGNFTCFSKHISEGICNKVFNILSLVKSSNAKIEDLYKASENLDEGTKNKIHDLCLILNEYEILLDNKLDANGVLNEFKNLIQKGINFQSTNFYFAGFDALTIQGYSIVEDLIDCCKSFTIGCLKNGKSKNSYIIDEELLNNIVKICENKKLTYQIVEISDERSSLQKTLSKNLFSLNIEKSNQDEKVKVFSASNLIEEVSYAIKTIEYLVKERDYRYKNFVIASANSNINQIDLELTKFKVPHYVDNKKSISQSILYRFIEDLFNLKLENFSKQSILSSINCELVCDKDSNYNDIENYIYENDIEYKKTQNIFDNYSCDEFYNFVMQANKFKDEDCVNSYNDCLIETFENFNIEEKLKTLCEGFQNNADLENEKIYIQLFDTVKESIQQISNNLGFEEISFADYCDLVLSTLSLKEISTVPLSIDGVYIGDCSSSSFCETRVLIVIGANEGVLPVQINDLGLLPDKEIIAIKDAIKLTPTVKMINKREKYKLFDLLCLSKESLVISYSVLDQDGKQLLPSSIVNDILTIFGEVLKTENSVLNYGADDFSIDKIKFNNPTLLNAKLNYPFSEYRLSPILKNVLGITSKGITLKKEGITNTKLFFDNNTTKISQIESFYSCPFIHYARYGLKLIKRQNGKFEANDFGNFLHEVCEKFAKNNKKLGLLDDDEVEKSATQIFDSLVLEKEYKLLDKDKYVCEKQILKDETIRVCKFINYEQSHSQFKIDETTLEKSFTKNDDISVSVKNDKYHIIGRIDRVDTYKDNVRIIDYKTGSMQLANASLGSLYFGTKIQVYVYLKAITKITNKNAFGAFYLPINNSFSADNDKVYKLHGFFLDDINLVRDCDDTLSFANPKSRFIEATISVAKNNINNNEFKLVKSKDLTKKQQQGMINYAVKMVENAIIDILNGNVSPDPIDGACEFCEYKDICGFEVMVKEKRNKSETVKKEFFEKWGE